jgi:hypothetical protein
MPTPSVPLHRGLDVARNTVAFGTAFTSLIRPYSGDSPLPQGKRDSHYAHVTKVCYTTAGTAHLIQILRPFNLTTFAANAAGAQKVVKLVADPGLYATGGLQYPLLTTVPRVADNAIAAGAYCIYQAADGTWVVDTANSSWSAQTVTMSTNLPTGGVTAGGLFYFFGNTVATDLDPSTGYLQPQTLIAASQVRDTTWSDPQAPVVSALHAGDPLLFYSPNPSATGLLEYISGYYGQY